MSYNAKLIIFIIIVWSLLGGMDIYFEQQKREKHQQVEKKLKQCQEAQ